MTMMYYYARFRPNPDGDGRGPDLPEDTSYLVVATPGRFADWAILRCDLEESTRPDSVEPVSAELAALLRSGERYPPALALSRRAMDRRFRVGEVARADFDAALSEELGRHLREQRRAGYVLAEARVEEHGYLTPGEHHWVLSCEVGPDGQAIVEWVSGDFHIYRNAASDFALEPEELLGLVQRALVRNADAP